MFFQAAHHEELSVPRIGASWNPLLCSLSYRVIAKCWRIGVQERFCAAMAVLTGQRDGGKGGQNRAQTYGVSFKVRKNRVISGFGQPWLDGTGGVMMMKSPLANARGLGMNTESTTQECIC